MIFVNKSIKKINKQDLNKTLFYDPTLTISFDKKQYILIDSEFQ